jgi:flagellar basal-body rod modification protein FlgD
MATTPVSPAAEQLINSFNQAGKKGTTSAIDGLQDRFLKLLVTQMQNQDPLNPMDNAQVTTQLAQISTVSGVDKLNQTLNTMSSSFLAAQSLQASGLIGRSVLAPGNDVMLQAGVGAGGIQLTQPADQVTVTIRGSAGETVKTIAMGAQPSGLRTFRWDGSTDAGGRATDGAYTFEVAAVQGGKKIDATALGVGAVQSVSLGGTEPQLNTTGLGAVAMSLVKQIL